MPFALRSDDLFFTIKGKECGTMKQSERISATSYVVDSIRQSIQNGRLKVGDRLPREAEMAEELGVGRSTLREAIKILNTYGVVESQQRRGTYIVDKSAQNFFEFMGFFPSLENDLHYLELRRVVEGGSIVAVHDKLSEAELTELEKLVNVMNETHTIDDYVTADVAFHHALIAYSQNPLIIQINKMLIHMRRDQLNRLFCSPEIVKDAYIEHQGIVQALRTGDLMNCINAVNVHLDKTSDTIRKMFETTGVAQGSPDGS